jgi:acyl-[acyl-carrier-protein]-phospholipid O-acyltransferase / long-chain-fatty-acid--[acyl-carrier-protein] ligase
MLGYLGQPEKTAEVLLDGWYNADIALHGRRWVHSHHRPAVALEQNRWRDGAAHQSGGGHQRNPGRLQRQDISPVELWRMLSESDLPKLWIPKQENFRYIESLPALGSGKLDLKRAK